MDHPLHSRRPAAPGLALIGDAVLTGDPLWGVGCGWALQSAQWLAEAVAPAVAGHGGVDRALAVYARRHRHRRLTAHQLMAADFARARPFNPAERLVFAATARDADLAPPHAPLRLAADGAGALPEPRGPGEVGLRPPPAPGVRPSGRSASVVLRRRRRAAVR